MRASMKKNAKWWESDLNDEAILENVLNIEKAGDKVLNDVKVWWILKMC